MTSEVGHAGVLQTLRELPAAAKFVLLGVFINQFGAFLQAFMVLYLVDRGFAEHQAGVALGTYSVGAIFGVLFGGMLSDRLGPRWTIVLSVGSAAIFTLSVTTLSNFLAIVVVVALAGAMTQAARPAVTALLLGFVPESRQVMVLAMYRTALNSGVVAGPLVAAWLSTISWNLVFYFDAASALLYAAIAAVLLAPARVAAATEAPTSADAAAADKKASYLTMLRDRKYLAYLGLMLANGLVHIQFMAVLPLMLLAAGYSTWAYSTATAVSAALVISCELVVTKTTQKWPLWVAVMAGWTLLVIGRGAFGLPGGFTIVLIATIIGVAGQIIGGPSAFAYPAKVAPAGAVGRYIGSAHALFGLGYAIGPMAGVLLWAHIGNAFWAICLGLGLAMIPVGIWAMRPSVSAEQVTAASGEVPTVVKSTS